MRVCVGLLPAVAVLATAVTVSASSAAARRYDPCPERGAVKDVFSAAQVADGAYAAIRRVFPRMNYAQGATPPVTRRTTLIREVIQLNLSSKDALAFRRLAANRCGRTTALRSWVVVVAQFPLSAMASISQSAFFLAYTTHGWRLYWSVFDHH